MSEDLDLWVAERLRQLREERGVTLAVLAEHTGISSAHLSRLEKGDRQPSIGSLLQLARVYGVSLSQLVREQEDNEYQLIRATDAVVHHGEDGRYTVLSGTRAAISVVQVVLPRGKRTAEARHAGEEWLHVLSGSASLTLAGDRVHLEAEDSIHFDSAQPHQLTADSRRAATVLIASTAATMPMHHPIPRTGRE